MRRQLSICLLALAFIAGPANAQQAFKADAFLVNGTSIQIDSTAGTVAGNCETLSGTFPKQTVTGGAAVDARTTVTEAMADSDRCGIR